MVRRKPVRTRGKLQLSKYFQEFEKGDAVAIIVERGLQVNHFVRLQGRTGVVEAKRGKAYLVNIKDHNKMKQFLIEPIHLKKIENIQ